MDPLLLPLLFIAALALPLFLSTRRQKRAIAEAQRLQSSLVDGDRVVTTSGLYGTVVASTDSTTVDLEIAPGVRTRWLRAAIREKVGPDGQGAAAASTPLPSADEAARTDQP
jgi:preprotein translocase subunit YajC